MLRWYVINTYSGHENKVRANILRRVETQHRKRSIREVVVPTEQVVETNKDGQKVQTERRTLPGYVLVNMDMGDDDAWSLIKDTPGVTGFVGATKNDDHRPPPLTRSEVDRLLHTQTESRPKVRAEFTVGESIKVISGPLSDFTGEIAEINADHMKLKVLVNIFGRETLVEMDFSQVAKL